MIEFEDVVLDRVSRVLEGRENSLIIVKNTGSDTSYGFMSEEGFQQIDSYPEEGCPEVAYRALNDIFDENLERCSTSKYSDSYLLRSESEL